MKLNKFFIKGFLVSSITFYAGSVFSEETSAVVYKKVLSDGSVSYSDTPSNDSTKLELAPLPIVPSYKPERLKQGSESPSGPASYSSFSFIKPQRAQSLHSGSGSVNIELALEPKLSEADTIKIFLDNKEISTQTSLFYTLTNVDRGTHHLRADIVNKSGVAVHSTSTSFTIHRPIQKRRY